MYELYCGDNEKYLNRIVPDAIITDPPYGIGMCNRSDGGGVLSAKSGNKTYSRKTWDSKPAKSSTIERILSFNVPTVIWGGNYFSLPPTQCLLIWDKGQRGFSLADAEIAWTNLNRAIRIFDYSRGEANQETKFHPTQKPTELIKWVLRQMRLPQGVTICDPYMGSGTTGVAALQLGFRFIGIELDEHYYKVACKRLADANRAAQGQPKQLRGSINDYSDAPLFAQT